MDIYCKKCNKYFASKERTSLFIAHQGNTNEDVLSNQRIQCLWCGKMNYIKDIKNEENK